VNPPLATVVYKTTGQPGVGSKKVKRIKMLQITRRKSAALHRQRTCEASDGKAVSAHQTTSAT